MSDIFESVTEKLGLSKEGVLDQASKLLDQNRDKIPDPIEGKIEEALHGDMLGGLLDKVGLGGHHEAAAEEASEESTEETEESAEEEKTEEDSSEENSEESTEEETSDEETSEVDSEEEVEEEK